MVLEAGITDISTLPGLSSLWNESLGDPRICVAVLDGPVDRSHPSFQGALLDRIPTLISETAGGGIMSMHGTHITSVIFGQHDRPVRGIAPNCRGLIVPVFSDDQQGPLSQLDLARAINQAVEQGAHVINISGGQLSQRGEADPMLAKAVRFCNDNGVLIVAAAGNDACQCLHVPAALPSVLAVGAMNAQGLPFDFSNWGETYQTQGILAPGENILGAIPGGGTAPKSGTSFATPIVSGIVALLLSIQLQRGEQPDSQAIRDAILQSALPCNSASASDCRRFLVGSLNIPGAYALITKGVRKEMSDRLEVTWVQPSEANPADTAYPNQPEGNPVASEAVAVPRTAAATMAVPSTPMRSSGTTAAVNNRTSAYVTPSHVVPSEGCGCNNGSKQLVYALGTLNYDFGGEARRDSFMQLMPDVTPEGIPYPPSDASLRPQPEPIPFSPNPHDALQIVRYLAGFPTPFASPANTVPANYAPNYQYLGNPSEAGSLIWTLNMELTPIYAIAPEGPYANLIYDRLVSALAGQLLQRPIPENFAGGINGDAYLQARTTFSNNFVSRVSIPGYLTGKTVTLFSGQIVPVITPQLRGLYAWHTEILVDNAIATAPETDITRLRDALTGFLDRVFFDLRNLGTSSADRALNYAATNAFQTTSVLRQATGQGMILDKINVDRSPFCRMDSDCWDVQLTFFDPENNRRARRVYRFTIDVSDVMPVTVGDVRSWPIS
jgi:cyanobactin maturation PatA/PatG family protease